MHKIPLLSLALLAGARAAAPQVNPCTIAPYNSQPWCDTGLSLDQRVGDLVGRIPNNLKPGMLSNSDAGTPGGPLSPYQWWNEGLHGVADSPGVNFTAPTPGATSFPQVITTAASFDVALFEAVASTISTEARVFNNNGNGGGSFWTPNINIFRDPRWGRGQETPGEDPFLSAEYAAHFIKGFQQGEDPRYLKASACAKHFTAYDLENWNGTDRFHFNAVVSQQDLADTINVPFQSAVERGQVSCVMCSYQETNSVPSCADEKLLTTLLKDTWGFGSQGGYVVSDCGAIQVIQVDHHYTNNTDETMKVVVDSGMTQGCDDWLVMYLQKALDNKVVTQAQVDSMIAQNLAVRFRLGQFDNIPQPYQKLGLESLCTESAQALSLQAAREGVVLLKNANGALPIKQDPITSVAIIGPNGNATETLLGNYFGTPCSPPISVFAGVQNFFGAIGRNDVSVSYTQGTGISDGNVAGFPAAVKAAQSADVTVLVMGLDQTQEAEGLDRTSIGLPGAQNDLMKEVANAAKGPVILVMINGGGVDISWAASPASGIDAILAVGYPGPYGGQTVAETVFWCVPPSDPSASNLNPPAGRLVSTWYGANYTSALSMFDMNFRPQNTSIWPPFKNLPGRTYRFYQGQPVFPFGFGLSYTTFTYSPSLPSAQKVDVGAVERLLTGSKSSLYPTLRGYESEAAAVAYRVNVTNTGAFDSDVVVLGFVVPPGAGSNGIPLKELFGFQRVHVAKGQTLTVNLALTSRFLTQVRSTVDAEGKEAAERVAWPGRYRVVFGVGDHEQVEATGFEVA